MPLSSMAQFTAESPELQPVLRVAQLRALEARHGDAPLMERAGSAAAEVARAMLGDRGGPVVVLAGPGNNGGDAFVVARWLRSSFHEVIAVFRGDAEKLPNDAAAAHAAFLSAGGATTLEPPSTRVALIVDGLFGIGLRRAPAASHGTLIEWANRSDAPILALDIPSGLDADTGAAFSAAIRPDATATLLVLKPGLLACGALG